MSEIGISQQLNYINTKKLSPSVGATRFSIGSENVGTSVSLTSTDTTDLIFSIPAKARSFLDVNNTYLRFGIWSTSFETATPATATAVVLGGNGSSILRSITVMAGGQILEFCDNMNVLSQIWYDMQVDPSARLTRFSHTEFQDTTYGSRVSIQLPQSSGTRVDICVPLLSGVLGGLCTKHIPMHVDMGLQVILRLEQPNLALRASDANNTLGYTIYRPTMEVNYIEMHPEVWSSVYASNNGVFTIPTAMFETVSTTLPDATTSTILIPIRKSSLKSLLCVFRDSAYTNQNSYSVLSRTDPNIQQYSFRVGGKQVPATPVVVRDLASQVSNRGGQAFAELLKAFHAVNDTSVGCGIVKYINTTTATPLPSTDADAAFILACELEGESHNSQTLFSGVSSLNDNIFCDLSHHTTSGVFTSTTFGMYDAVMIWDMNAGTVKIQK